MDTIIEASGAWREWEVPVKRWQEAVEAGKGAPRPVFPSLELDPAFSLHYERTVKKDATFSFRGREFKLNHCAGRAG